MHIESKELMFMKMSVYMCMVKCNRKHENFYLSHMTEIKNTIKKILFIMTKTGRFKFIFDENKKLLTPLIPHFKYYNITEILQRKNTYFLLLTTSLASFLAELLKVQLNDTFGGSASTAHLILVSS